MSKRPRAFTRVAFAVVSLLWWHAPAAAQDPATRGAVSLDALTAQVEQLRVALVALQHDLAAAALESQDLRRQLDALRQQLPAPTSAGSAVPAPAAGSAAAPLAAEEHELLAAKVDDLEQSKVESGSRYHVRLSGLALLNVTATSGAVDSLDLPLQATPRLAGDSDGAISAGLRQSSLTVSLFGPLVGGARTAADVSLDFFGAFPGTADGLVSTAARLRTATLAIAWPHVSLVAGQDVPFFSPLSPTSLAASAYPALSGAGNVWSWTPELFVERRASVSNTSELVVQAGILDPLTGELPAGEYSRVATAGERTRRPAEAARFAWRRSAGLTTTSAGFGVYHSAQNWGFDRTVDAWAALADVSVPLGRSLEWSGEIYRGRAIGGLGGGLSRSVLFQGQPDVATTTVLAVESAGGWSQIKVKPATRFEFNVAGGLDSPYRTGLARLLAAQSPDGSDVTRNASGFVNAIWRVRSNILFSVEFRRLWTTSAGDTARTADHLSISSGFAF